MPKTGAVEAIAVADDALPAAAPGSWVLLPEREPLSADAVEMLLQPPLFPPYRHWRGFGREVPRRLMQWELLHSHDEAGARQRLLFMRGGDIAGLAWAEAAPWESRQLGVAMAHVRHLLVPGISGAVRRRQAEEMLQALAASCRGTVQCLVHRVDVEDAAMIAAVQGAGAQVVDTLVSFLCDRRAMTPRLLRQFRDRCVVRDMAPEDAPQLEAIVRASRFDGRLYRDARLPPARVDALYLEWARQCWRGAFADRVLVAERGGVVVGFLASQLQRRLETAAGIRLAGHGLMAASPGQPGIALELVRRHILLAEGQADFGQFDIHVANLEHLALYSRVLRLRVAHVRHVFHQWLDGAPPA